MPDTFSPIWKSVNYSFNISIPKIPYMNARPFFINNIFTQSIQVLLKITIYSQQRITKMEYHYFTLPECCLHAKSSCKYS